MKKNKIIVIICIIIILVSVVAYFTVTYFLNKDIEKQEQELQDTIENYGTVSRETVDVLVAKFNTQIMDNNSSLNPASTDYLTIDDNKYWYGLFEGIYLVVVPEEFNNEPTNEIVDYMLLFVDKGGQYEANSEEYVKYLIKANNESITDEEINTLLEESKKLATSGETSNNGKGISIGYIDNADNVQYQVIRLYK